MVKNNSRTNHALFKYVLFTTVMCLWSLVGKDLNAKQLQLCPTVRPNFIDVSGGEDYLHGDVDTVHLPFAFVRVINDASSEEIWSGYMDEEGCTEVINFEAGTPYRQVIETRLGTVGNRNVYLPIDGYYPLGTENYWFTEPAFKIEDTWTTADDLESSDGSKILFSVGHVLSPRIQLMLVASRMLALHDVIAYPADTTTIFKVDGTSSCDQGQYGGTFNWGEYGNICATSTNNTFENRHLATDAAYYKFATGHELGHRIQYANGILGVGHTNCAESPDHQCLYGGWVDQDNDIWVDNPNDPANIDAGEYCGCSQVQPLDGSQAHCFQSREPVSNAMEEGYGHFVSSVLFNDRPADGAFDPEDCWFAYVKQGWSWYYVGNDFNFLAVDESPPVFHTCSNLRPYPDPDAGGEPTRYPFMDNLCNPGDEDVGIERDWLSFYWSLYADDRGFSGDHRFNVGDVLLSFGLSDRNYNFQKSLNAADAEWLTSDPVKSTNFRAHSLTMGVAHCKGGCVF